MMNSGMQEAIKSAADITDFDYNTVEVALELCYDRKISTLTWEEKAAVLQFFDKYQVRDLKVGLTLCIHYNIIWGNF